MLSSLYAYLHSASPKEHNEPAAIAAQITAAKVQSVATVTGFDSDLVELVAGTAAASLDSFEDPFSTAGACAADLSTPGAASGRFRLSSSRCRACQLICGRNPQRRSA